MHHCQEKSQNNLAYNNNNDNAKTYPELFILCTKLSRTQPVFVKTVIIFYGLENLKVTTYQPITWLHYVIDGGVTRVADAKDAAAAILLQQ